VFLENLGNRWYDEPPCGNPSYRTTRNGERAEMSYRNLTIWQEARSVVVDVHKMTLTKLPNFELYEEGSQIRRSIKSVKSNIVEGYGRRRYKQEYIRFLTFALASCDETTDHLETL
jgi:four helix bundle protein